MVSSSTIPFVSFCMSTYKRPELLKQQLELILKQSFRDFEIVISDNDPDCSARNVIHEISDSRLKYFSNVENIGMLKSFNISIERSRAENIIMITDDDPVVPEMLENFKRVMEAYPGYGIYIGCSRVGKKEAAVEVFDNQNFLFQLLNPKLTNNLLWSSCVLKREVLLSIGGMPDYGSPHLADHAMMGLCGKNNGGVIINKMYSQLTSHDSNFSKSNIDLYYVACKEFYELISRSFKKDFYIKNGEDALHMHLEMWFITNFFALRKYFTFISKNNFVINQIDLESSKILKLPFMKTTRTKFFFKLIIFNLKKPFFFLNILR